MKTRFAGIFSVLIAVCMLFSVPVSAETALPETVSLCSCHSSRNWSMTTNGKTGDAALSADVFTTAPGSIGFSADLSDKGETVIQYKPGAAAVMGENNQLVFDVYVESRAALKGCTGFAGLSSSDTMDDMAVTWSFAAVYSQITADGWNTVTLELLYSNSVTSSGKRFDKNSVKLFCFKLGGSSSSDSSFEVYFDNMRFTASGGNSTGSASSYTAGNDVTVADETLEYGDISLSDGISSADALLALQYAVGKINLTNEQMTLSDVNFDGNITAADALLVLQLSVGKIESFGRVNSISANDYMSQINVEGNRLVTPLYETDKTLVAVADVVYFGAVGDGVADDTKAFRLALSDADSKGGGVVFVPVGKYKITSTLTIPNGVTLRGDAPDIPALGKPEGTIIYSYVGMGSVTGPSLFNINAGSGVKNMAIYYPEQDMNNIKPCTYTFKETDQYGPTVESVLLVNSYNGITFGPAVNALQTIRNVAGTVLNNGYFIDYNVDICRLENVSFSPDYWIESGLGDKNETALRKYVRENCTALIVEAVDWTYMTDISVKGAKIALQTRKASTRDAGAPNGQLFNFSFTDCEYGYYCSQLNDIGHMFTDGYIEADVPVYFADTYTTGATFKNVEMKSLSGNIIKQYGGAATFTDCVLTNASTAEADKVTLGNTSSASFTGCELSGKGNDMFISPAASVTFIAKSDPGLTVRGDINRLKKYFGSYETESVKADTYDYERSVRTKALNSTFIDMSSSDYDIASYSGKDVSSLIQSAINDCYELGGGTVYVPGGKYLLENPITVKSGVELMGISNTPHHSHVRTTMFYSKWGMEQEYDYTALINLESQSGIQGFNVMYTSQRANALDETGAVKYGYTVRADGFNTWVVNVLLTNSYYGVDMFTNRCDGHYVEGLTGTPLKTGIKVGGGSAGGLVRDIQFNVHYFGDNPIYSLGQDLSKEFEYCIRNVESIILGETVNEIFYNNFMLGAKAGLVIEESPKNAFVLAHGSDGANYSCYIRGREDKDVTLANSQFVCTGGYSMEYIYAEYKCAGSIDFIQTNFWGSPNNATYQGGGNLRFFGGTLLRCGANGMQLCGGSLVMQGIIFRQPDVNYAVLADGAESATVFGNIYAKTAKFYDPEKVISGFDLEKGESVTEKAKIVTLSNCDTVAGWQNPLNSDLGAKLDTAEKTEGTGSIRIVSDPKSTKMLMATAVFDEPVNAGYNDQFTFDIYVEDPSLFVGCSGQIELTSSGASDIAEVAWYPANMATKDFKAGWNTVTFNFSKGAYNSLTDETFDKSAINFFRLYIINVESSDTEYTLRFDNLRFTSSLGNE